MKTKYIPNTYSMFDDHLLTCKLERMARKGWQLQKIGRYLLTFHKAEPQELHYTIGFFPGAEAEDPTMLDDQLAYINLCSAAGWELAASYGPMQVFCNAAATPVPLETDDALKLKAIDGGMGKTHILLHLSLTLIALFWLVRFNFESSYLTQELWQTVWLAAVAFTMIRSLLELFFYFRWIFRGSRQVELGLSLPSTHTGIRRTGFWLWIVLWLLAFLSRGGFRFLALYAVILILRNSADTLTIRIGKKYLQNAASVRLFLALCSSALVALFYLGANEMRMITFTPPYEGGATIVRSEDSLPITLEELDKDVPNIVYSYNASSEKSLLMEQQTFTQVPIGTDMDLPEMELSIRHARFGFLNKVHYESILKHYLTKDGTTNQSTLHGATRSMSYTDPETGNITYALLYCDRVLYLYDLSGMTEDDVALIIERLQEV